MHCFALIILLSSSHSSGTVNLPSGIENPMPVRFPQLLTAPSPSWLSEGVRATYSVLAGSSETEHFENKDLGSGQAGNGVNQLDVVAIENGQAAIVNEAYAPGSGLQGYTSAAGVQGALHPLVETGSVAAVGCGDFWCSPDVLQNIPVMANNNGLTVQRLQKCAVSVNPGVIDTDPDTGMKVSVVQNDANEVVFEKTNQMDFKELYTYDLDGKLVQAYYEYNPDVMTSVGFGSVKTIILQLVG